MGRVFDIPTVASKHDEHVDNSAGSQAPRHLPLDYTIEPRPLSQTNTNTSSMR